MAGVANVGTDRNWCGSVRSTRRTGMPSAVWRGIPTHRREDIAERMGTHDLHHQPGVRSKPVVAMMMGSREAAVNYMTPLGLAHQMGTGHHYGPGPWIDNVGRPDWNPVYYNTRRQGRHRLRPHAHRQQRRRAICAAAGARSSRTSTRRPRNSCFGSTMFPGTYQDEIRPHAVGRVGDALYAGRRTR